MGMVISAEYDAMPGGYTLGFDRDDLVDANARPLTVGVRCLRHAGEPEGRRRLGGTVPRGELLQLSRHPQQPRIVMAEELTEFASTNQP
jgi:hypothetical protein